MSNMPVHVNVIWDPTLGMNFHTLWVPPLPPAPIPVPSLEVPITQLWLPGEWAGQNKFTTDIFHRGVFICIDDHDIGTMIPDITFPPINAFYLINWPFSKRQMAFTASTVKMNGKPTSCSQIMPPLPMMTCGDPLTLPLSYPIANLWNTLTVGLTFADFVMGYVKIAVSMVIDAIFSWGPIAKFFKKAGGTTFGAILAEKLLGKLGLSPDALAKNAVNAVAGLIISAVEGNPTFKMKVGGGIVPEVGIQIGGDAKDVHGGEVFGIPFGVTTGGSMPSNDRLEVKP